MLHLVKWRSCLKVYVLELLELMKQHKIASKADFDNLLDSQAHEPPSVNVAKLENATSSTKFPRISLFYGETGKGEVTYRTWRYEVNCLLRENTYNK